MELSDFVAKTVICGSLAATGAGLMLAFRAVNRRIRLLSITVVLLTFCEISTTAIRQLNLKPGSLTSSVDVLQLTACALALSFVQLLSRENRDRSSADIRLRVLDSDLAPKIAVESDRRTAQRFRMEQTGVIHVLGQSRSRKLQVRGVDLSESGACVLSTERIHPETSVRVDLCGQQLPGYVVFCEPSGPGYSIGISLSRSLDLDSPSALPFFNENAASTEGPRTIHTGIQATASALTSGC